MEGKNDPFLQNISESLPRHGSESILKEVHVGQIKDLRFKDEDIEPFLDALSENTTFKGKVNLGGHELTDQSLLKISKIIQADKPLITYLSLEGNSKIGAEGLRELGGMLCENNTLIGLNIGGINTHFTGAW